MRKKKRKIKKKSLLYIIIVILIIIGLLLLNNNKHKNSNNKISKPQKTEYEKKLDKLNNIDKKIDYYNKKYTDRYISYKEKNPDLNTEQVIKNVNMFLDYNFYENTEPSKYLNDKRILVNKHYYLTENYIPENLEEIDEKYSRAGMKLVNYAKSSFEKLSKEAKNNNMNIIAMSSYRSYEYQVNLYNRYVNEDGKEEADTYSGRPGHSEHQTGLAVDVYNVKETYTNFERTKEFNWMQEHAHEYGFILRFPKGKENETGYQYESWHYRYVGEEIAKYIHDNNITLEEYYATKIKDF